MGRLEVIAHLKVRPGQLDAFKRQAAELVRLANELDTGTLRYDWFLSRDGTECEVHEAYTSSQSMMEHAAHIAEARNKMFAECAEDHVVKVFGEPSAQFFEMVEGMQKAGQVRVTWFSYLQDLASTAHV
jgi:quinol monooxygenase YgiN